MRRALFITLDNTLISTRSGQKYALHSEDWKLNLQVVEAIREFTDKSYLIFIITNQVQIEQGLVNEKTFNRKLDLITSTLEKDLKLKKGSITCEYCTNSSEFKYLPNPGMIYQLALEFELSVKESYFIGNSEFDKTLMRYSGIGTYINASELTYSV
jgi:D-glycero-D-manno-heptose 1,7-bisphosphate phosphatase